MDKFDIKKERRDLYAPRAEFTLVEVPEQNFIAVDGRGNPNTSPDYAAALEALYSVAYTLKFSAKRTLGLDSVVGPLEGLWRAEDPADFARGNKDAWEWTMMISQPGWITPALLTTAVAEVKAKKGLDSVEKVRWLPLAEGLSVQILHKGPYADEGPVLARLHNAYMPENGLDFNGDHHEIYLSDPRRAAPEKLKTVLRQPVRRI
ncbi:GyrI-like domain-containing protein [Arthrobacter sp.]|uniref:GyrI-like domain-containing protein n=1 Tax=Arthrobacter sp. TaxID=1667 RepID=UPI00289C62A2|nr:GyrI-like domain-containing protein [Arthrobacter sp.]